MAVGSGVPYNPHTGNGVTKTFGFGFTLLAAADLVVTVDGVPTGDFTITGLGAPGGGAITFTTAPANGAVVLLRRVIQLVRAVDYPANGDLLAGTLNEDLDRLWLAIQQGDFSLGRSLRVPEPAGVADLPAAASRANKLQGYDSAGNPTTVAPVDGTATALAIDLADGSDLAKGTTLIANKLNATASVGRRLSLKLAESVTFDDFGAAGDGVTDDTAEIQAALNSTAKLVIAVHGKTYLVDGGLTSSVARRTISAYGATIKLKDNAAHKHILDVTGARTRVEGGEWDGNRANGNAPTDTYTSYAVALVTDRATVVDAYVRDFHGIGLKGFGNHLSYLNNEISGTTHYGIFVDGASGVSHKGNRACGNVIDMSNGGTIGQGILFSAGGGQAQTDWLLDGNDIIGPSGAIADQAINLAVRGHDGVVSNNLTRYGSMGFSEGGNNCVVTGNRFLQLRGSYRIGIEPSGTFVATGNLVTDAYVGVDCTAAGIDYTGSAISGGQIIAVTGGSLSIGVRLLGDSGRSAKRVMISGVNIKTAVHGVYLVGDVAGTTVAGCMLSGPGVGSGRGVFLDAVSATSHVYLRANTFEGFERPWSVYSLGAVTHTDLRAESNVTINCGSTSNTWPVEGSAVIGARCAVLGAEAGELDVYDVAANVFTLRSTAYGNPNGLLAAGPGSIYVSKNSGGGVHRKDSGTSTTGWAAM